MDNITALGIHIITRGETIGIRRLTDNMDDLRENLINKHKDLSENNSTVRDLEVRIQFETGPQTGTRKEQENSDTPSKSGYRRTKEIN